MSLTAERNEEWKKSSRRIANNAGDTGLDPRSQVAICRERINKPNRAFKSHVKGTLIRGGGL